MHEWSDLAQFAGQPATAAPSGPLFVLDRWRSARWAEGQYLRIVDPRWRAGSHEELPKQWASARLPVGNNRHVALARQAMSSSGDTPTARWQSQRLATPVMVVWGRFAMAEDVWPGRSVSMDGLCHRCRLGSGHGDEPSCSEDGKEMATLSRPCPSYEPAQVEVPSVNAPRRRFVDLSLRASRWTFHLLLPLELPHALYRMVFA